MPSRSSGTSLNPSGGPGCFGRGCFGPASAAFVRAQIFSSLLRGTRSAPGYPEPAAMAAPTEFDYEWMDSTTNARCPRGGRERAKEGGGDEGTGGRAPQTTPWGPGRGREGGGTATARPPGYSPRRGPRSTTTCGRAFQCPIVVLVGRPRRSAASADRQVRWRALAVVPCRHKLTGWKEAVMGGGRGARGLEGGMALAEERRSSPNAHPSFPPSLTPERSGAGATSRTAPSTRGGRGPGGSRRAQHHRSRSWAPSSTDLQDQETPSSTDLQDQERARRRRGHRAAAAALLTAPTEGPGA